MKTNLLKSAFALVALCSALHLQAENIPAASHHRMGEIPLSQVTAVTAANGDTVVAGTARIMVSMRLGSPNAVLPDGSWLYSGYTANLGGRDAAWSGTLVVRFVANKVSSLTLADKAAVVALRSTPRNPANDKLLAANQPR